MDTHNYIYIKNTPIHWERERHSRADRRLPRCLIRCNQTDSWDPWDTSYRLSICSCQQAVWLTGWAPWLSQLGHTSRAAACYLGICQADGENMHCESQGHRQVGSSAMAATGGMTEYAWALATRTKPARIKPNAHTFHTVWNGGPLVEGILGCFQVGNWLSGECVIKESKTFVLASDTPFLPFFVASRWH